MGALREGGVERFQRECHCTAPLVDEERKMDTRFGRGIA